MASVKFYKNDIAYPKVLADKLNKLADMPDAMEFKGSLGVGGTITALPVDGSAKKGDTYKVITDGTYAGQTAKIGDLFICNEKTSSSNTWVLIPSGDEPSGTVTSVKIEANAPISVNDSTPITSSGTRTISHNTSGVGAGSYGPTADVVGTDNTTIKVPQITVDSYGHITGVAERTYISKDTDTKVTSAANHYGYTSGSGKASGLYKVATDDAGHVTETTAVAKADITALGIPDTDTNTHRPIQVDGTEVLGDNATPLNLSGGTNISLSDDGNGKLTIDANIPKVKHELIYYDNEKLGDDEYDGLFTQQLMLENVVVVDNQQDFDICKRVPIHPNIQDTFQQFSESPFCPEYGNGLSLTQYSHTSPIWGNGKAGYGYNSWHTSGDGSVISTNVNSDEFNGYIYPHKVRKITSESLIGAYSGGTSGDIETITLLNTNHAKARRITTTDGRTFYRDAMFDLVGSSSQTNYCAWVYKPSKTNDAYIIYSTSEQITSQEVNNGLYWTDTTQSNWNPETKRLTKEIAQNCPGNAKGNPSYNSLTNYYKDAFPTKNTNYTVYHAASIDTLADRRNTTVAGTARVDETYEAEGYLGALHILISNCRDINSMFLYGSTGIIGTVMVYGEIIPISGADNPTTECTDKQTLFSFLRNTNSYEPSYNNNGSIKNWPTYNSIEAYGMFPFKHQRRYFITVKKDDCWRVTPGNTDYKRPSTIDTSLTSGDRLVPFQSKYDMTTNRGNAVAILNKFSLEDGTIRLKFSQVGASEFSGNSETLKEKFTSVKNFYLAGTEHGAKTPLDYSDSELVINFKTKKYTLKDYNGNVVANNLDLVSYEDNLTTNDGDSIERTGNTKYDVTVVEHGIEKNIDICSLFTEEVQFMYGTTSLNYHSLNCILLSFNDKVIYRADDNTIWKLNDAQTDYVLDPTSTVIESFTGSRLNYNNITEKLWYSNGSQIYELKTGSGGGGTGGTSGINITTSSEDETYPILLGNTNDAESNVTNIQKSIGLVVNPKKKSVAEGEGTTATGNYSHAEGSGTTASGNYSHAEGHGLDSNEIVTFVCSKIGAEEQNAIYAKTGIIFTYCVKNNTINNAYGSQGYIYNDEACTQFISEIDVCRYYSVDNYHGDYFNIKNGSLTNGNTYYWKRVCLANGDFSHVEGNGTTASGESAHAEGSDTTASGEYAHAEGSGTTAGGYYTHAEGNNTTATGYSSHAEGSDTTASGLHSHAEGSDTTASGESAHAEGSDTTASGEYAHAEGIGTMASGNYSHASGQYTIANRKSQTVVGEYNDESLTDALFVVGNGTGEESKSNAFYVKNDGSVYASGAYYSASDKRKKDIIGNIDLEKAYSLLETCQTVTYTWKDDESKKQQVGVIAQEIQQFFPEIVNEDEHGMLSVDYSRLTVILLAVIRDLTQKVSKIDTLEEKIKQLENKIQ